MLNGSAKSSMRKSEDSSKTSIRFSQIELSECERFIGQHHFNHKFSLLSGSEQQYAPENGHANFYQYGKIPLTHFLDPSFIRDYVANLKYNFVAMSVETNVDSGDTFCIHSNGKFCLNIGNATYEHLGLQAAKAFFPPKGNRWLIQYDLASPSFRPGKKNYDRAFAMLEIYQPVFNIVVSWTGEDGASVPIDFPLHYGVRKVMNGVRSLSRANDVIPEISSQLFADLNSSDAEDRASMAILDWIGGLNVGLNKFVSDYESQLESEQNPRGLGAAFNVLFNKTQAGSYSLATHTGVIAASRILTEFKRFHALVNQGKLPWCCFSVWGFEDALVSWKNLEHSFYESGENDFVFFLLPESKVFLYKITGLHDRSI